MTRYEKIVFIRPILEELFNKAIDVGIVDTNDYGSRILDIIEGTENKNWEEE